MRIASIVYDHEQYIMQHVRYNFLLDVARTGADEAFRVVCVKIPCWSTTSYRKLSHFCVFLNSVPHMTSSLFESFLSLYHCLRAS